jgi:hypothetical protein
LSCATRPCCLTTPSGTALLGVAASGAVGELRAKHQRKEALMRIERACLIQINDCAVCTVLADCRGKPARRMNVLLHVQERPRQWSMARQVARRSRLLSGMMAKLGLDPGAVARLDRGRAFAGARRTCLGCMADAQCQAWLDGRRPPADLEFCANRRFFAAVSASTHERKSSEPIATNASKVV